MRLDVKENVGCELRSWKNENREGVHVEDLQTDKAMVLLARTDEGFSGFELQDL